MSKKKTIEYCRQLAESKNLIFLDDRYVDLDHSHNWECKKCGYKFHTSLRNVRSGKRNSCASCYGNVKHTTEDCHALADRIGGKFLDDEYVNARYQHNWQCAEGHFFKLNYTPLNTGRRGCPTCGEEKAKKTRLEKYGSEHIFGSEYFKKKVKETFMENYGVDNPMKDPVIAAKSSRNSTQTTTLFHWRDGSELTCQASYEVAVVNHLNSRKIPFMWQPRTFAMPDGRTYRPDLYLPLPNKWIEIKGVFRDDAEEKWLWFHSEYANSELWMEKELQEKGIV